MKVIKLCDRLRKGANMVRKWDKIGALMILIEESILIQMTLVTIIYYI